MRSLSSGLLTIAFPLILFGQAETTTKSSGFIRGCSGCETSVIQVFLYGDTIKVTDYDPEHDSYRVIFKDKTGYLPSHYVKETEQVKAIKEAGALKRLRAIEAEIKKDELAAAEKKAEEQKNQKRLQVLAEKARQDRKARLIAKYGEETATKLLAGKVWIGMTNDMALESRGKPIRVSRVVTASVIGEDWIYSGMILGFADGVLTTYHDQKMTAPDTHVDRPPVKKDQSRTKS